MSPGLVSDIFTFGIYFGIFPDLSRPSSHSSRTFPDLSQPSSPSFWTFPDLDFCWGLRPLATGRGRPLKKRPHVSGRFWLRNHFLRVSGFNSVRIGISMQNWYRRRSQIRKTRFQCVF